MATDSATVVDVLTLVFAGVAAVTGPGVAIWQARYARKAALDQQQREHEAALQQQRRDWARQGLEGLFNAAKALDIAVGNVAIRTPGVNMEKRQTMEAFWRAHGEFSSALARVEPYIPKAAREAAALYANDSAMIVQTESLSDAGVTVEEVIRRHDVLDDMIRRELGSS